MKTITTLILTAAAALLLAGCGQFGAPAAPSSWNSEWCRFKAVDSHLRAAMQRAFANCASVEYRMPLDTRSSAGRGESTGKLLWQAKRGGKLDAILAQLAAVPHWYVPHYSPGFDIALHEQDLAGLRFLDAEGKPLYEQVRRCAPVCMGEGENSKGIFAFFPLPDHHHFELPALSR